MNEQYQASGQNKPAAAKWLWITLIVVVLLGGAFAAWYFLAGPGKTVASSTTTTTTTPVDETADWLTYSDTVNGYSIKYPSIFTLNKDDLNYVQLAYEGQEFKKANNPGYSHASVSIGITDTNVISLEKYIEARKTSQNITEEKTITLDTISAKKITSTWKLKEGSNPPEGTKEIAVIFEKNSKIYDLGYQQLPTQKDYSLKYETMLSTFKFTAAAASATTSTADWKTYTNDTYKFSVKYPKDWTGDVTRNNTAGNLFTWATDNEGMFNGITLNITSTSKQSLIQETKTNIPNSVSGTQTINGIEWTTLDIPLKESEHNPPSFSYYYEKNGKTYQIIGENSHLDILKLLMQTFQFTK